MVLYDEFNSKLGVKFFIRNVSRKKERKKKNADSCLREKLEARECICPISYTFNCILLQRLQPRPNKQTTIYHTSRAGLPVHGMNTYHPAFGPSLPCD